MFDVKNQLEKRSLAYRGAANWQSFPHKNYHGWRLPVFDASGDVTR
jgi:hypothetical protein